MVVRQALLADLAVLPLFFHAGFADVAVPKLQLFRPEALFALVAIFTALENVKLALFTKLYHRLAVAVFGKLFGDFDGLQIDICENPNWRRFVS